MCWTSQSPDETRAFGRSLAESAPPKAGVVTLVGPLGAGKTVFAKGVAQGLGLTADAVSSPTFVLAQELATPRGPRLVHADFYRVESPLELEAAGLHDWLAPETLLLAEWGERFPDELPADRLQVELVPGDTPDERGIRVRTGGVLSREWLARWRDR